MDLNRVRLFVEVVDRGSFTAAAAALGLPKSSVSRGVARLEEDLGTTLLRRTTRTLTLTDAGRAYADRARAALHELTEATHLASEASDEPHGLVRVTAPSGSGGLFAEPIARFSREHPRIQLDLVLTGREVDLAAEGFDLAIRAGRLADSSLIARKIADSQLQLHASPAYLAARGHPATLADVADHDCVVYRGHTRWTLTGPDGATDYVDVRGRIRCDEMPFLTQLVEAGLGIGLVPAEIGHRAVAAGTLAPVLRGWAAGGASVWIVHPPMRHMPRRVALLRDFLITELRARVAACVAPVSSSRTAGTPSTPARSSRRTPGRARR